MGNLRGLTTGLLLFIGTLYYSSNARAETENRKPFAPPPESQPQQPMVEELPPPPLPVYVAPEPIPSPLPTPPPLRQTVQEKPPAFVKPVLFRTSFEKTNRSQGLARPLRVAQVGFVSAETLSMQTVLRESRNDLMIVKREHEYDLINLATQRQLFDKVAALYKKQVATQQDFEGAKRDLIRRELKAEASKYKLREYEGEEAILSQTIQGMEGNPVPLVEHAKVYAHIWESRMNRARIAAEEAEAELQYHAVLLKMNQKLAATNTVTHEELLRVTRDWEEARVLKALAEELFSTNQKNWEDSLEDVKKAEQQEETEAPESPRQT